MMFPMLNSLKLEFVILSSLCIFYQVFSWIMRLDAIQDQLCEIAPSHNTRSPAEINQSVEPYTAQPAGQYFSI